MPGPPVSVTAGAVSSTGTMPSTSGWSKACCSSSWVASGRVGRLVRLRLLRAPRVRCGPWGTSGRVVGGDRRGFDRGGPGRTVLLLLSLEAAGGDVAVAGGGVDVEFGGAVVLEGVADAAVTGAGVQCGRDAGGGADRDVAHLGVEDDRAARGLGDPDAAPGGADLRGAAQPADLYVAVDRGEADARDLVDLDLPV